MNCEIEFVGPKEISKLTKMIFSSIFYFVFLVQDIVRKNCTKIKLRGSRSIWFVPSKITGSCVRKIKR